jgi:hypothetical protein
VRPGFGAAGFDVWELKTYLGALARAREGSDILKLFFEKTRVEKMTEYRFWKDWELPLVGALCCGGFLAVFFGVTLTGIMPLGDFVARYFEDPLAPDGFLAKDIGIDKAWKLAILWFSMTFLNALSFYTGTKYVVWRWNTVFSASPQVKERLKGWRLPIFCLCCVIIELFLTTVAIVNILVSFTNYLMLFSIAVAHGIVIWIIGREKEPDKNSKEGAGFTDLKSAGIENGSSSALEARINDYVYLNFPSIKQRRP